MKKDRNSFFQSSNFNMSASNMPGLYAMPYQMGMDNSMMPQNMSSVNATNQFYQQGNMPLPTMGYNYNDLEARMAKLERTINRLEARINKLESTSYYTKENYEVDGNMYIV